MVLPDLLALTMVPCVAVFCLTVNHTSAFVLSSGMSVPLMTTMSFVLPVDGVTDWMAGGRIRLGVCIMEPGLGRLGTFAVITIGTFTVTLPCATGFWLGALAGGVAMVTFQVLPFCKSAAVALYTTCAGEAL